MKAGGHDRGLASRACRRRASPAAVRVVTLERQLAVARGNYTDRIPRSSACARSWRRRRRGSGRRGEPSGRGTDHDAAGRPELPRAAGRPASRCGSASATCSATRRRSARRSACIGRASNRRRASSSRSRRCSASTTSRNSSTPSSTTKLRNAEMNESLERNRGGEQFAVLAAPLSRRRRRHRTPSG